MLDSHADIGAEPETPGWHFYRDTRYLWRLEMLLNETRPLLPGSNVRDDNSFNPVDLTNPDICLDRQLVLPKTCCTSCARCFCRRMAYQSLLVQNHGSCPFGVRLSFAFASDFADLFEVRGLRRKRRSTMLQAATSGETGVALAYRGLDGIVRRTTFAVRHRSGQLSRVAASYAFELQPP